MGRCQNLLAPFMMSPALPGDSKIRLGNGAPRARGYVCPPGRASSSIPAGSPAGEARPPCASVKADRHFLRFILTDGCWNPFVQLQNNTRRVDCHSAHLGVTLGTEAGSAVPGLPTRQHCAPPGPPRALIAPRAISSPSCGACTFVGVSVLGHVWFCWL